MDKLSYIEKIKASTLSDEAKQQIVTMLENNELNTDTKEIIKDIIQKDIDNTIVELTDEDAAEVRAADEQLAQDLATVESDLNTDMAFVEAEMNDIATMTSDLDKATDEAEIDAIKASI